MRIAAPLKTGLAALALGALAQAASAQDMPPMLLSEAAPLGEIATSGQNPTAAQLPSARSVSEIQNAVALPSTETEPAPSGRALSAAIIDQLVAPVALYPDPLLSQVLMAATYPLEVIQAARWIDVPANQALTGAALSEALKSKNWNPSITALIAFPDVLKLMADKIEWTEQLGNTFLTQQADVMAEVQQLRHKTQIAGNLKPQVTAATRAAPKRAGYYASRPPYRRIYNYAPYRYAYNYAPYSYYRYAYNYAPYSYYRYVYNQAPYSYYGPAPYHSDGY
jgi:hypothetical protein